VAAKWGKSNMVALLLDKAGINHHLPWTLVPILRITEAASVGPSGRSGYALYQKSGGLLFVTSTTGATSRRLLYTVMILFRGIFPNVPDPRGSDTFGLSESGSVKKKSGYKSSLFFRILG
jgi:hypothetical protein